MGPSLQLFLWSVLRNLDDEDKSPYPTAEAPLQKPVSATTFKASREQLVKEVQAAAQKQEEEEVDSGPQRSRRRSKSSSKPY